MINKRLTAFLDEHKILPETQSGFRRGRSTQDQLFRLTQDVTSAFQNNMVAIATMYDVEKAFDKVWHGGLLLKLKYQGLNDATTALIRSFISDRQIRIKINDVNSRIIQLHAGTPQGAILSATIFGCWVSDVPQPEGRRTQLSQYADDIATWTTNKSMDQAEALLQRFNNRLVSWSKRWRIKFSAAKTKVIKFHRKRLKRGKRPGQTIDGRRILAEDETEFLGLTLDRKLTFKKQDQKIMKELKRKVKMFSSITGTNTKPRAPTSITSQIFNAMIIPTTTYGTTATCIRTDSSFAKQDIQLRKAARLAIHAPYSVRNDYLEREIGLMSSKERTTRLAKNYILSQDRCTSIKDQVRAFLENGHSAKMITTPLGKILSE